MEEQWSALTTEATPGRTNHQSLKMSQPTIESRDESLPESALMALTRSYVDEMQACILRLLRLAHSSSDLVGTALLSGNKTDSNAEDLRV